MSLLLLCNGRYLYVLSNLLNKKQTQMKKILLSLLAMTLLFSCQQTNSDLSKQYNSNLKKQLEGHYDIVPFPGEEPQNVKSKVSPSDLTNWGKDLLLSPATKLRLATECKNKVVVKVFDTSGKTNHSFLVQGQLAGKSYTGEATLDDGNGHGTHCAGIICADQLGLCDALVDAGLVKWKPVKILTNGGSGDFNWFAAAVTTEDTENKTLLASGTFVVGSCSFGGGTAKVANVETALKNSTDVGVLYAIATGNTSGPGVQYPGNSVYAIGIGSIDQSLKRSSFSSYGPEVWNGMPGRNINSTYLNNTFATMSGTSMATPFEAGVLTIVRSRWGKTNLETLAKVKNYLAWCSNDLETIGKDELTGWGDVLVNSILDKDPKNAPDMGNPLPPNPNPPSNDSIPHTPRVLNYTFSGSWPMIWNNTLPPNTSGNKEMIDDVAKTFVGKRTAGSEILTITKVEVSINSKLLSGVEYKRLKTNIDWFFTNRGLQLENGSDYADATYWSGYFLEMMVQLTSPTAKQSFDVTRIEGTDKNGRTVVFFATGLRHF